MTASQIIGQIQLFSSPQKAEILSRFFKTGKGEYGEGDVFIGVTVPNIRKVCLQARGTSPDQIIPLLLHPVHECRMCGFLMLLDRYRKVGSEAEKEEVYELYMQHRKGLNNWDLVDLTAPGILGAHLLHRDRSVLHRMVAGGDLWEQRMAVLATFTFLRNHDFADTLLFCTQLMSHRHDLIHKATGWMLREAGKRDLSVLTAFLDQFASKMPRTMLRYAIEKLPENQRLRYLSVKRINN